MTRADGRSESDDTAGAVGELIDSLDGRAAAYARRLDTGVELCVGDIDRLFPTGSAAKFFVLLTYLHATVDGRCDAYQRVNVTAAYRDARGGSGVLRHLNEGLEPTLHDCATLMMIVSDNVATDLVLDAVGGPSAVNATLERLGLAGALVQSPTVWVLPPAQFGMASPRGLADAWKLLAEPGPVTEAAKAITWRHQQREGFARFVPFSPDLPDFGLPSQLRLWSKSGSYPTVSCEGGLFETDDATWVLAVMADELADWGNGAAAAAPTLRANVSRLVFEAWSSG